MTDRDVRAPASGGVRNRERLVGRGNRPARELLVDVVDDAFEALAPDELLDDAVTVADGTLTVGAETYDLSSFEGVHLVGSGKGSLAVVEAMSDRLEGWCSGAMAVEKRGQARDAPGVRVLEADHPVPSAASRRAGEAVLERADSAGPDDLVIVAVTGGTSALLAAPAGDIDTGELAEITDQLLRAGAPIEDLNAVRKHLSRIKGGQLAERLSPATVVGLIVVDEVAGEPWGPTVADETGPGDSREALRRYGLWESAPAPVRDHLDGDADGTPPSRADTPRTLPSTVHNVVLADGTSACEAAARAARERGYEAPILSTTVEGESADAARALASIATEVAEHGRPFEPPCVLVSGGETTVTVPDDAGAGGPNQEFALACARVIEGADVAVAAVGTDGTDGPTDAAGGLVDGTTARRARECGVDIEGALRGHDSTAALEATGDVIYTGPGTNVMDLRLMYVGAGGRSE